MILTSVNLQFQPNTPLYFFPVFVVKFSYSSSLFLLLILSSRIKLTFCVVLLSISCVLYIFWLFFLLLFLGTASSSFDLIFSYFSWFHFSPNISFLIYDDWISPFMKNCFHFNSWGFWTSSFSNWLHLFKFFVDLMILLQNFQCPVYFVKNFLEVVKYVCEFHHFKINSKLVCFRRIKM